MICSFLTTEATSALILFDISSALDTIDQSILVHRLHTDFAFSDTALQWFSSYLSDHAHYVSLSFIVPLLLLYILVFLKIQFLALCLSQCILNPLSTNIDLHSITHHSFADDLQLHMSVPSDKISELLHSML